MYFRKLAALENKLQKTKNIPFTLPLIISNSQSIKGGQLQSAIFGL